MVCLSTLAFLLLAQLGTADRPETRNKTRTRPRPSLLNRNRRKVQTRSVAKHKTDVTAWRQEESFLEAETERLASKKDYATAAVIQKRLEDVQAEERQASGENQEAEAAAAASAAEASGENQEAEAAAAASAAEAGIGEEEEAAPAAAFSSTAELSGGAQQQNYSANSTAAEFSGAAQLQNYSVNSTAAEAQVSLAERAVTSASAELLKQWRSDGSAEYAQSEDELDPDFRPGGVGHALFEQASSLLAGCTDRSLKEFDNAKSELEKAHDALLQLHTSKTFSEAFQGFPPTDTEASANVQRSLENMIEASYKLATVDDKELKSKAVNDCQTLVRVEVH